jgi:hypothetical protein
MTTTTATAVTTPTSAAPKIGPVVKAGLAATVVASAATTAVAALGNAAGISLDMAGEPIPVLGFATLTAFFSVIGVVLAVVLARTVRSPRHAFVRTTQVLTALSLVPDAIAPAAGTTIALLMVTHLVAAAIVIPAIARRLSR